MRKDRSAPIVDQSIDLQKNACERVARPDTSIEVGYTRNYVSDLDLAARAQISWATLLLKNVNVLLACVDREREGYDGIILNDPLDSALREAREWCNIPVVGLTESSLLFASVMGDKAGLITAADRPALRLGKLVESYGFKDRVINRPVRSLDIPAGDIMNGTETFKKRFEERARECIKDGADVVVVLCTLISVKLAEANVKFVDGVPVLGSLEPSVKLVEALSDFRNKLGFHISRKRVGPYYNPLNSDEMLKVIEGFGLH
jgi:Asp/Glu/hydantoin racemase